MQSSTHWLTDHRSPCEIIFQYEVEEEGEEDEEEEVEKVVEEASFKVMVKSPVMAEQYINDINQPRLSRRSHES